MPDETLDLNNIDKSEVSVLDRQPQSAADKLDLNSINRDEIKPVTNSQDIVHPEPVIKDVQPETIKEPGFFERLGSDYTQRAQDVISAIQAPEKAIEAGAGAFETARRVGEAGLRTVGEVAGGAFDPVVEGLKSITPGPIKDFLSGVVKNAANTDIGKNVLGAYKDFETKHPDAAKDLGSVFNIALLGGGGEVEQPLKEAAVAATEALRPVGKAAEAAASSLEEGITKKSVSDALELSRPELKPAEKVAALAAGRGEEKGILKTLEIKPSARDNEIAQDIAPYVSKGASPVENINALRTVIATKSQNIESVLRENDAFFSNQQMTSYLDKAKEASRVTFGSDKALESGYDSIKDEFMNQLAKQGGNKFIDLFKARQAFDKVVESKFPRAFNMLPTDNVRINAIRDIRTAVNDYIGDNLPVSGGNKSAFKAILRQESNMYQAIDNIAAKTAGNVDTNLLSKAWRLVKNHPFIATEVTLAGGFWGGAMIHLLSNPIAWGSLIAYGSYRIGKSIITSEALREGLISVLKKTGEALNPEEKSVMESLIDSLPTEAGLSIKDVSKQMGKEDIISAKDILEEKPKLIRHYSRSADKETSARRGGTWYSEESSSGMEHDFSKPYQTGGAGGELKTSKIFNSKNPLYITKADLMKGSSNAVDYLSAENKSIIKSIDDAKAKYLSMPDGPKAGKFLDDAFSSALKKYGYSDKEISQLFKEKDNINVFIDRVVSKDLSSQGYDSLVIEGQNERHVFDFEKKVGEDLPVYAGSKDLTTKILDQLKGKSVTSKQEILDLTNQGGIKQAEKDLIRNTVKDYGEKVPVKEFADKVQTELLPLKRTTRPGYSGRKLPDELIGPVANHTEHVYESPIKTSAGITHQRQLGSSEYYFAHTSVEDLPPIPFPKGQGETSIATNRVLGRPIQGGTTRRVTELQSDLMQKGRTEYEYPDSIDVKIGNESVTVTRNRFQQLSPTETGGQKPFTDFKPDPQQTKFYGKTNNFWSGNGVSVEAKSGGNITIDEAKQASQEAQKQLDTRTSELAKLEPYRNTWYERIIREEVKQAAKDGKTILQFPTGETIMKIEGLGDQTQWTNMHGEVMLRDYPVKVGLEIRQRGVDGQNWIITDVLGDGKFNAMPKDAMPRFRYMSSNDMTEVTFKGGQFSTYEGDITEKNFLKNDELKTEIRGWLETFDISGKVNTNNPIYRFYEKEAGRYLKNTYNATQVTDKQGVNWWQLKVPKSAAEAPVQASSKDKNKTYA